MTTDVTDTNDTMTKESSLVIGIIALNVTNSQEQLYVFYLTQHNWNK